MQKISSFAIQYGNINGAALLASGFDLLILEGSPASANTAQVPDDQIRQLGAQGRITAGYVNVGVTDSTRPYWRSEWSSHGPNQPQFEWDLQPLTDQAPTWLRGMPTNSFGYYVQFWSEEWQGLVVSYARDLVNRGYTGVFLDDVAAYRYVTGVGNSSLAERAGQMMDLVNRVGREIRLINPDAVVIVNGHASLVTDAAGGINSPTSQLFLRTIDGMLLESQFGNSSYYGEAQSQIQPSAQLLGVEHGNVDPGLFAGFALSRGVVPYSQPGQDFLVLGTPVDPSTNGMDTLEGGPGPNRIDGRGGDDTLFGRGGNDTLTGSAGSDMLDGGPGADLLTGGTGDDRYAVDSLADVVVELPGEGTDTVFVSVNNWAAAANVEVVRLAGSAFLFNGGSGAEQIYSNPNAGGALNGGGGDDLLSGTGLAEFFFGGDGRDTINGLGGVDSMAGGEGDDLYIISNAMTVVTEGVAFGTDTASVSINGWTAPANLEIIRMEGQAFAVVGGSGNEQIFSNALVGGALNGGPGADTLWGTGLTEYLNGGPGDDSIVGSGGADTLIGDLGSDTLSGGTGADSFRGDAGNDLIYSFGGADLFGYSASGFGQDVIIGFAPGLGKLDFRGSGLTFSNVSLQPNGGNVRVMVGGDSIVLSGIASVGQSDFLF